MTDQENSPDQSHTASSLNGIDSGQNAAGVSNLQSIQTVTVTGNVQDFKDIQHPVQDPEEQLEGLQPQETPQDGVDHTLHPHLLPENIKFSIEVESDLALHSSDEYQDLHPHGL
ncbi:uncharacterized protein LOC106157447 [Lingula anatina]|uniref:Uncharacterized protein LOC106157447 n=1 Tax=Lingula anatina TaxID=7574 RepID=A0A1S3HR91_LINAN|nr:uncharacterized protein LOC106157447 [Lingula anatina]|eukprot:XP_013388555.1 uncharacterized protein LOC106157447 [Lingula anatina]